MKKISLFYYQNPNFGDSLSAYIVERLSGCKVKYRNPLSTRNVFRNIASSLHLILLGKFKLVFKFLSFTLEPVLIAVGSLLEHSTRHCVVWGTGMAQPSIKPTGGRFIMTRGFLSRKILTNNGFAVESDICGDPAILMPLLYHHEFEVVKGRIGIIPHVSEVEIIKNALKDKPEYMFIDFRQTDVDLVLPQLLSCDFIYSSSLHGLILCHAYGIPCLWFQNNKFAGGDFKFNDHFSAVGITPYKPLDVEDVKRNKRLDNKYEVVPRNTINKIQKELIKYAPFPITAKI